MKKTVISLFTFAIAMTAGAQNPIIQSWYTPDPAPYVHNDTVYLFVDHDEDEETGFFNMKDWQLYSSVDMVNWTYRGTPITLKTFPWANQQNDAWAAQTVERNGRWYWYVAVRDNSNGQQGIGVAVSDRPEGPYTDPLGKALVRGAWGFIDPSVFVDDDERAYLVWGNNGLWMAELGDDMVSLRDSLWEVDTYDVDAFGPHVIKYDWAKNMNRWMMNFEEAPWLYKVGDTYYLEYASGGVPERWAYSTAKNMRGPWTYCGEVMGCAPNSFTIHGGTIDYHNRQFMFYHCGRLPMGHGYHRSTSVEEYQRGTDGSIPFIPFTDDGVKTPVRHLSPYSRVEAETMAWSEGLKTDQDCGQQHHIVVAGQGCGKVRSVDFGQRSAKKLLVRLRTEGPATVEMHLDSQDGPLAGIVKTTGTKGQWQTLSTAMTKTTGIHDVYLVYKGQQDVDWWQVK